MKTIVHKGIDYFWEAITLLEILVGDMSPQEAKKSLIHKHGVSPEELEEPFGVCIKIFEQAKKRLKPQMETVREYFTSYFPDGSLNKAGFALLTEYNDYESTLKERKETCLSYSEKRRSYEFYRLIQQGYRTGMDIEEGPEECKNLKDLLEYLNVTELTGEQKWQIQWVFNHPLEAYEAVEPCIRTALEVIKEHRALWQPLVEQFYENWSRRLSETDFHAYFMEQTGYSIEENPQGTVLLPSVMATGAIAITTALKDVWKRGPFADVFRIGVLVEKIGADRLLGKRDSSKKQLAELFKILSDESKLEILSLLRERRYYGGELAKKLKLSTATISHHMSILLNGGLVVISKEGNRGYYVLDENAMRKLLDQARELLLRE